ncbi:MAG: hypothetical protein M1308_06565 [Actinobacteria bacterium]|nr:hypothetical protein [Actinomycetota bacterium]
MSYKENLIFKAEPDFERLRTALKGGVPDRIPFGEFTIDKSIKESLLGRPVKNTSDDIEFFYRAGYDHYWIYIQGCVPPERRTDKRFIDIYSKTKSFGWSSGNSWIADREEFKKYPWDILEEIDFSPVEEATHLIPDRMKIIVNIGPFFSGVWRTMGINEFSYALFNDIGLIKAIIEKIAESFLYIVKRVLAYKEVQGIMLGDDLAFAEGLMVNPDFLREHIFPWEKQIGDLVHYQDKLFIRHSDGLLYDIMDDFIDYCGYDALNPFEPKAMDINFVKKKWGKRVAIIGNIDIDLLARGTSEEVKKQTIDRIKTLGPGGGYALGSSNSITSYTKMENYYTMLNTLYEYGRYPIL